MMHDIKLPSSPNWYNSQVADININGLYAFGSRSYVEIISMQLKSKRKQNSGANEENTLKSDKLDYLGKLEGHHERVTAVKFFEQSNNNNILVSCAEDGNIMVWDVLSMSKVIEHNFISQKKLTTLGVSPLQKDLILAADEKGLLEEWRWQSNETSSFSPEKGGFIHSIVLSPYTWNHAALGYRSGMILIIDLKERGNVIRRFHGHNEDVLSLQWQPLSVGIESPLLASSSKDRTIRLWNTETQEQVSLLKGPSQTSTKRERYSYDRQRIWMNICWPKNLPTKFISSSSGGDMVIWDISNISKPVAENFRGTGHSRIVFNICCGGPDNTIVCSTSLDRQIVVWNMENKSSQIVIPTIGGYVNTLSMSSVNPGYLAIGSGDDLIRIMNLNSKAMYEVNVLWQGIKSKVSCISWHPRREGLLAFGTEDGRVGICDSLSNKTPVTSCTYHNKIVFGVEWGPSGLGFGELSENIVLYSVGDGTIFQHDPSRLDKPAANLNDLIKMYNDVKSNVGRSVLRWKTDMTAVAIGLENGIVEIYNNHEFKLLGVVSLQNKLVSSLAWHPEFTGTTVGVSEFQAWIAFGSNDSCIYVINTQSILDNEYGKKPVQVSEPLCRLEGHRSHVTWVAWSHHRDGMLLSASRDGTVQVWNARTATPIANFRGHTLAVMCAVWSSNDEDVIFSGGQDCAVISWRISKQAEKKPPETKRKRLKANRAKKVEDKDKSFAIEGPIEDADLNDIKRLLEQKQNELKMLEAIDIKKDENLCTAGLAEKSPPTGESTPDAEPKAKLSYKAEPEKGRKKPRSLIPVCNTLENRGKSHWIEDCKNLADFKETKMSKSDKVAGIGDYVHLGPFHSRRAVYKTVTSEQKHHEEFGNWDLYYQLEIWKGNIENVLKHATENQLLSDWIIAMASFSNHPEFLTLCRKYAEQLEDEGFTHKATTFLLLCHDVKKAIELLKKKHLYRDALILMRLHLNKNDPMVEDLYRTWIDYLTKEGITELVARCHVALDEYEEAAQILSRRGDVCGLEAAVHLCQYVKNPEIQEEYMRKLITKRLTNYEWEDLEKSINVYDFPLIYRDLVAMHKTMIKDLAALECIESLKEFSCESSELNKDFISTFSQPWKFQGDFRKKNKHLVTSLSVSEDREKVINELRKFLPNQESEILLTLNQVLLFTAVHLCLAIISSTDSNDDVDHVIRLIELADSNEHPELIGGLCRLLISEDNRFSQHSKNLSDETYLLAFYYTAVLKFWKNKLQLDVNPPDSNSPEPSAVSGGTPAQSTAELVDELTNELLAAVISDAIETKLEKEIPKVLMSDSPVMLSFEDITLICDNLFQKDAVTLYCIKQLMKSINKLPLTDMDAEIELIEKSWKLSDVLKTENLTVLKLHESIPVLTPIVRYKDQCQDSLINASLATKYASETWDQIHLIKEKKRLKLEMDKISDKVKSHPYPDVAENIKTFLTLLDYFAENDCEPQSKTFLNSLKLFKNLLVCC